MKKIIKLNLINICLLSFLELIFGILMFDTFIRDTIISVFIHILFSSFIITLLTTLFNRKINKIINLQLFSKIIFLDEKQKGKIKNVVNIQN